MSETTIAGEGREMRFLMRKTSRLLAEMRVTPKTCHSAEVAVFVASGVGRAA
jgi:hypothetical protein